MDGFSLNAKAMIDVSIEDFGTDRDKAIWEAWLKEFPDTRTNPQLPDPNGNVLIRIDVRETIIICLRRNYEHTRLKMRSPLNTHDEMALFSSNMSRLYAIARRLSRLRLEWPSDY